MATPFVKVFTTNFTTSTNLPIGTAYYTPQQSDVVNVSLIDTTGVSSWALTIVSCSDNVSITDIVPTFNGSTAYTFTMPAKDCSFILQSEINGGVNSSAQYDSNLVYTFKVGCTSSKPILAYGETYEESATSGWTKSLNDVNRYRTRPSDALTTKNLVYWMDAKKASLTYNTPNSSFLDAKSGTSYSIPSSTSQNSPQIVTAKPYGTALMLSGDTSIAQPCVMTYSASNTLQAASIVVEQTEMYTTSTSSQRYLMGRMNNSNTSVIWGFFYETSTRKYGFEFYSTNFRQVMLGISPVGLSLHQLGCNIYTSLNLIELFFNGTKLDQASAAATALATTYPLTATAGNLFFGDDPTATGTLDYGRTTYIHDARYYNTVVNPRVFQNIFESTI